MSRIRNFNSFLAGIAGVLIIGLLPMASLAAGASDKHQETSSRNRVLAPVNLAILIQDDLVSHVSNELDITRQFIRALPEGSQVMVGYITSGSLQVRQPFTTDLRKAAGSLRILISSSSASPFNPYVEAVEGIRKFDAQSKNRNVLLLITDGLDTSRGFDAATVINSIDMERAIAEAKRRNVLVYSFYAPSVGLTRRNFFASSYGQSALNRLSHDTGGKAFFQGTDFVSFNPYFERLERELNQLESVE
jgi:hypothetical protein